MAYSISYAYDDLVNTYTIYTLLKGRCVMSALCHSVDMYYAPASADHHMLQSTRVIIFLGVRGPSH